MQFYFIRLVLLLTVSLIFFACKSDDDAVITTTTTTTTSTSSTFMEAGDLVVSNNISDAVLLLDSNGNFKNVVFNVVNTSETVSGLAWSSQTKEVFITVDGVDRVVAVSAETGAERTVISDANLTGTLRGIARLTGGDILIAETNNVERYNSAGFRVTSGGWPKALQNGAEGLSPKADGGFVHCSITSDVVRTYNSSGTQENTRSSGIAGTTDAYGCIELANGNIAVTWSGTTDTVVVYDSALSGAIMTYSDTFFLGSPTGLAERSNGNILILDAVNHHIVEISSTGAFVNVIGDAVLNGPRDILVVPSF